MKMVGKGSNSASQPEEAKTFTDDEIRSAFQTFDLDKNMYIGPGEIRHILGLLGEQASNEEIDEMIRMCDSDGSGLVSFDEFRSFFSPPEKSSRKSTDQLGQGGSVRVLNRTESNPTSFHALITEFCRLNDITPNWVRSAYKRVQETDKSHTGRLGYNEFLIVLRCEDSELMKRLFNSFDTVLMNEVEVKHCLVSLIMHSRSIKLAEKLKITFSMMRSPKAPNNSIDRESLKHLVATYFLGYEKIAAEMTIDERVDILFKSSTEGFLSFDNFMDIVETNPELALPLELTSGNSS
jgi:Ca2+-binding EF-hand superfamily protein